MASEFGATYLPGGLPVGETLVGVGPVADRPDANSDLTPRFWFDSSTGLLYVDDSGTWYTLIPGTLSANTYTGNVVQRITSTAQGTSGGYWAIKISGETLDRAFLYSFGVGLGGGSSSVDAVMRRTQAKEIGFYDASVLGNLIPILAGEPTSDSHVATKNYVDTNAGGTVDVVSNVATSTILGRTTAGTGDSEELTPSAARTLLDVPSNAEAMLDSLIDAAGDIVVGTADNTPSRLAIGADRRHLVSTGTAPAWEAGGITLIAETVLGSDTSSISFSSIPATYRHLYIEFLLRTDLAGAADNVNIAFNTDTTAANYDSESTRGAGSTGSTTEALTARLAMVALAATAPANHFGIGYVTIPYYASAQFKALHSLSFQWRARTTGNVMIDHRVTGWASTAAINAIAFTPAAGTNFKTASAISLYGIG